jgi:polyisoprenoid-binding protein YceI
VKASAPGIAVGQYLLDKSVSRFTVRVFAGGMLSALGHSPTLAIRDFAGEASFDSMTPSQASLRLKIRADSIEVTDDVSTKDRLEIESTMQQKVLETSKFQEIVYEGAGISAEPVSDGRYKVAMKGGLSLHGVTRGFPVTMQVTLNGDMMRAYGEFSLRQSEYSIKPITVARGALKVKDELKFAFDIVARKQE